MELHIVSLTLAPESQDALKRLFAAAPITINIETLFCPVWITNKPLEITVAENQRVFEARPLGFRFPYSAINARTLLVIELESPSIDAYSLELAAKHPGTRSYFADASYSGNPYIVAGHGNDLTNVQRGWISTTSSVLSTWEQPLLFTGAFVGSSIV